MKHLTSTQTTIALRTYHKYFVNKAIKAGKTLDYILDNVETFCKENDFTNQGYIKYVILKYYKFHNIK